MAEMPRAGFAEVGRGTTMSADGIRTSVETVPPLTKEQFEADALFHGTPEVVARPSVRNSRLRAVFCTPLRRVAEQYAGPMGTVIAVRPKADIRIVDATGTNENENWHWIPKSVNVASPSENDHTSGGLTSLPLPQAFLTWRVCHDR